MKEEFRWYKNRYKKVHSRKESWFNSTEKEKAYKENFTRIKGEKDLSMYVAPKVEVKPDVKPEVKPEVKPKVQPKKKKTSKKKK